MKSTFRTAPGPRLHHRSGRRIGRPTLVPALLTQLAAGAVLAIGLSSASGSLMRSAGVDSNSELGWLRSGERYDPVAGAWSAIAPMPVSHRGSFRAAAVAWARRRARAQGPRRPFGGAARGTPSYRQMTLRDVRTTLRIADGVELQTRKVTAQAPVRQDVRVGRGIGECPDVLRRAAGYRRCALLGRLVGRLSWIAGEWMRRETREDGVS
jgi:hypothetical protein